MLEEKLGGGDALLGLADSPVDPRFTRLTPDGSALTTPLDTGGSGGYLENVVRHAVAALGGTVPEGPLKYKSGRNPDFMEAEVPLGGEGGKTLRVAKAYGFRNIQNLMRTLKRKKCPYDYVEVMACPSGCLNGGGQLKVESEVKGLVGGSIKAQKTLVAALDIQFHQRAVTSPESSALAADVYKNWVGDTASSAKARAVFHTQYHAVEKVELNNPLAIKW
jgi:iron only hydrogenase large subunit-like protein